MPYHHKENHPKPDNEGFKEILAWLRMNVKKDVIELMIDFAWAYWNQRQGKGNGPREDSVLNSAWKKRIMIKIDEIELPTKSNRPQPINLDADPDNADWMHRGERS